MQIALLLKLLSDYSGLLKDLGHPVTARELGSLQHLFSGQEGATVAKFVGALMKKKPGRATVQSEAIRVTRDALSQLETLLLSAQCRTAANDIKSLKALLEGGSQSTVEQFAADARSWSIDVAGGTHTALRTELVEAYLGQLQAARAQNDVFDQVMDTLRADKRARLAEVREIAARFLGFEIAKKKSRALALQTIADHQALDARQIARSPGQA
jgi:hypothetical protein